MRADPIDLLDKIIRQVRSGRADEELERLLQQAESEVAAARSEIRNHAVSFLWNGGSDANVFESAFDGSRSDANRLGEAIGTHLGEHLDGVEVFEAVTVHQDARGLVREIIRGACLDAADDAETKRDVESLWRIACEIDQVEYTAFGT